MTDDRARANVPTANPGMITQRVSVYAILSLLCSLAIFCPVLTIVGPLLGLRALIQIKADRHRHAGAKLAWWGIIIGVLATIGWAGGMYWWHTNARVKMLYGPREEIQAGIAGDVAAFQQGFIDSASQVDAEEARAFLEELDLRYGQLLSSRLDPDVPADQTTVPDGSYRLMYQLRFERAAVQAEARWMVTADGRPPWVLKFAWMRIIDPLRGDLIYPRMREAELHATPPAQGSEGVTPQQQP